MIKIAISSEIKNKSSLILLLVISTILTVDSSIIKIVAFGNKELSTIAYVGIFVALSIGLSVIFTLILSNMYRKPLYPELGKCSKFLFYTVSLTLYSLVVITAIVILQIIVLGFYNIETLFASIYISHSTGVAFLILLIIKLLDWLRRKREIVLILNATAFSLITITLMISLFYAISILSDQPSFVRPYSIHTFLLNLPASGLTSLFNFMFDILTVLSYLFVWVYSSISLRIYAKKIGVLKYWTFMTVPLIYFLFPFQTYFGNLFQPLMLSHPVIFWVTYTSIFAATKQAGAILFAIVFIIISKMINRPAMNRSMIVTAIGLATVFGAVGIDSIIYAVFPPFGLITISFLPVGSYLLFVGLSTSASIVARDKELRQEFYRTAESQFTLLKAIGAIQMEKELVRKFRSMEKLAISSGTIEDYSDESEAKDLVRDVLREMESRKFNYKSK